MIDQREIPPITWAEASGSSRRTWTPLLTGTYRTGGSLRHLYPNPSPRRKRAARIAVEASQHEAWGVDARESNLKFRRRVLSVQRNMFATVHVVHQPFRPDLVAPLRRSVAMLQPKDREVSEWRSDSTPTPRPPQHSTALGPYCERTSLSTSPVRASSGTVVSSRVASCLSLATPAELSSGPHRTATRCPRRSA